MKRAAGICGHAFVMLMDDDMAAKELAEQYEGSILEETYAVAGDGKIAGLRAVEHQFPQCTQQSCTPRSCRRRHASSRIHVPLELLRFEMVRKCIIETDQA